MSVRLTLKAFYHRSMYLCDICTRARIYAYVKKKLLAFFAKVIVTRAIENSSIIFASEKIFLCLRSTYAEVAPILILFEIFFELFDLLKKCVVLYFML